MFIADKMVERTQVVGSKSHAAVELHPNHRRSRHCRRLGMSFGGGGLKVGVIVGSVNVIPRLDARLARR